jgi:hypothetical protein
MSEVVMPEKINVDDVEYVTNDLPDPIKGLISIYQEASLKMVKAQRQVTLMEAARRALGDGVIGSIRQWNAQRVKELEARAAQAQPAEAPAAAPAPKAVKKAKLKAVEGPTTAQ